MSNSLDFHQTALGGQGQPRGNFLFPINNAAGQNFGARRKAAAGHLLAEAHQLVEMNFWRGNKGAGTRPAIDQAITGEHGQGMPCCH